MAYERQTWEDFNQTTPINAERLKHIEDGIFSNSVVKTVTTANTDLNDYNEFGVYYFSSAYKPANIPTGVIDGWLVVLKASNSKTKQLWLRAGENNSTDSEIYVRTRNSSLEWSDWSIVCYDSGWKIPTLTSGWTDDYAQAPTRYRKIGDIVYVETFVTRSSSATSNIIFTLPTGYRPSSQYKRYVCYYADGTCICEINKSGQVRVVNPGTGTALQWVCIQTSFPADA